MTTVENKIPDISSSVEKTDNDEKISDIRYKYVTTPDYNKFTKNIVTNKIKSKGLVYKLTFSGFISDLNKRAANISNRSRIRG